MRQITLGERWARHGAATLLTTTAPSELAVEEARRRGVRMVEWSEAGALESDCVVFDGYRTLPRLDGRGPTCAIADFGLGPLDRQCNLVLDQNAGTSADLYPGIRRHLLGPRYALVRPEFAAKRDELAAGRPAPRADGRRVLVSLGGTPDTSLLDRLASRLRSAVSNVKLDVLHGSRHDVAEAMAWADVALASAGSTTWELSCLGVPMVLLVLAPNQLPVATAMVQRGAAWQATVEGAADRVRTLLRNDEARMRLGATASDLVDGRGSSRVVAELRSSMVRVREAEAGDLRQLWEWANDPVTRANSFTPEPVSWDEHVGWFQRRRDAGLPTLVVEHAGEPLATVRFDDPAHSTISVTLAPASRGGGWGSACILAGLHFREQTMHASSDVVAFIKPVNSASIRAFDAAAFVPAGSAERGGHVALRYVRPSHD
jgi:UDP-2,4-diacetamido-2,4,6-trideoxy-beta-L-altropyranose hydrolase